MKISPWKLCLYVLMTATPLFAQEISPTAAKDLIREAFAQIIESPNPDITTYRKYFSPDYQQRVDGKVLNFAGFIRHMNAQKKVLKRVRVTFRHLVAENNKVASLHIVDAEKFDGSTIQAQVNAIFEIEDGKVVLCDELTRLLKGSREDEDLGSRTSH
jgi:hypothetical protein